MAAVAQISGFPFASKTAGDLWKVCADGAKRYASDAPEPGNSYAKWFSATADPLKAAVGEAGTPVDAGVVTAFQSHATEIAYLLTKWDALRNAKAPSLDGADGANALAREIVSVIVGNAQYLDSILNTAELGPLKRDYQARLWRACEAVIVDLEAWTSGDVELVRPLWELEAVGRSIDPSERALAEFATDPGSLASWSAQELGRFRSTWLIEGPLPDSLDTARATAAGFSRTLQSLDGIRSMSSSETMKVVASLATQAQALLDNLGDADSEARGLVRSDKPQALAALGPGIVASIDEAVRRIRTADVSPAGSGVAPPVSPGAAGPRSTPPAGRAKALPDQLGPGHRLPLALRSASPGGRRRPVSIRRDVIEIDLSAGLPSPKVGARSRDESCRQFGASAEDRRWSGCLLRSLRKWPWPLPHSASTIG